MPSAPVRPYQNVILVDPSGCATAGTGVMVGAGALVAAGAADVGASAAAAVGAAVASVAAAAVGALVVGAGVPPQAANSAVIRHPNRSRLIILNVWTRFKTHSPLVQKKPYSQERAPDGSTEN